MNNGLKQTRTNPNLWSFSAHQQQCLHWMEIRPNHRWICLALNFSLPERPYKWMWFSFCVQLHFHALTSVLCMTMSEFLLLWFTRFIFPDTFTSLCLCLCGIRVIASSRYSISVISRLLSEFAICHKCISEHFTAFLCQLYECSTQMDSHVRLLWGLWVWFETFQSCFGLCMTFCCYGDENAVFATVVMINWITHSQKNQWINTSLHVYCLLTDCISELILVIGLPSCASLWPGATLLPPSYRNQGSHLEPWATTLLTTIQTGKLLVYMLKTGTFECCSDMY